MVSEVVGLVAGAGGGLAVIGHAGSMNLVRTSISYSVRYGKMSCHVCRSLYMDLRLFSSTFVEVISKFKFKEVLIKEIVFRIFFFDYSPFYVYTT